MMIFKKDQRKLMGTDQTQKGSLTVCSWAFATQRTAGFRLKFVHFPFSSCSHLFSTFFITATGNGHVAAVSCGKWPVLLPTRSHLPSLNGLSADTILTVNKHSLPKSTSFQRDRSVGFVVRFLFVACFLKTKGQIAVWWAGVVLTAGREPHCIYEPHLLVSFSRAQPFSSDHHRMCSRERKLPP